jgi:cytochrome oxidase Cu insertion factor (SCO1/SenC/PrrC family)
LIKTLQVTLLCAFLAVLYACALPLLALMKPLEAGTPAPAFTLPDVDGKAVALSDFEGRPVLLNFWIPT